MSDENNVVDLNTEILKQIRAELVAMNRRIDTGFTAVDVRLESIDARLESVDGRLETITDRIDTLEQQTIRGFTAVRAELSWTNTRIDGTNARIDETNGHLARLIIATQNRFHALEGDRPRRPRRPSR